VSKRAIVLLMSVLLIGGAAAQTMPTDPAPPQTTPNPVPSPEAATSGIGHGDHAVRAPDDGNNPPANPPAKDETVGVGGSVDVAPRDIRDPFDE
jgi:hypothetical protein